ncbi:hypothetical protein CKM354_000442200 [Cercospora kikuchii]|uniref:Uncharacterized protein n=1 Tax=Cercospora kikuchii TaxID=84275 RepID=A0A9P3CFV3_9PEZI|nr:uncharacterized protein CKM354_000442200 [Cercospora kikuchii]GIZ41106.1 hypothetical protein CKM354_000442200 [Cercospora kikuchii]
MAGDSGNGNGDDSLKLSALIERLPQELQDIIYDMTFTADAKVHIYIENRDLRLSMLDELVEKCSSSAVEIDKKILPHLLWVNRHSRQKFASSYFGHNSVFALYTITEWIASSVLGSLRDLIPEPLLVFVNDDAQDFSELLYRELCVDSGMDAAFASRLIFINHHEVVKMVKQRAGISTEDAEVDETPSDGGKKAEN